MKLNKIELSYFSHPYNETWSNERYIEISLGIYFLNKFNFECVETGAVMPHYGYISNVVIDPFDDYKDAKKINALDYSYYKQNVLSISTIEHCKCDEYNNRSNDDSILLLHKIINESKNYLITWPIGYNKYLDNYVQISSLKK